MTKDTLIRKYVNNELLVNRFKSYLEEQPDECIEFTGYLTDKGYGIFNLPKGTVKAHRFAYAIYYGVDKLPAGTDKTQKRRVVHHLCKNKACVNPLHLESVTDRFNLGRANDKDMF
jgi:hypothetical protein